MILRLLTGCTPKCTSKIQQYPFKMERFRFILQGSFTSSNRAKTHNFLVSFKLIRHFVAINTIHNINSYLSVSDTSHKTKFKCVLTNNNKIRRPDFLVGVPETRLSLKTLTSANIIYIIRF